MTQFYAMRLCLLPMLAVLLTAGCSYLPDAVRPNERSLSAETDPVSLRIAESADKATTALQTLARMEQTQKPIDPEPVSPSAPAELLRPVTVEWSGPLEPMAKALAENAEYQFVVIGKAPAAPVVVRLNVIDRPIVELLRSIGLQATQYADLVVDVPAKKIELRYAPPTGK